MTTAASFLHWLGGELLGPPAYGSHWFCPRCEGPTPSLSVRPPLDDLPVKFKCHRCNWWGDEHDLLKLVDGITDYGERLERLRVLRARYESQICPAGSRRRQCR